MISFPLQLLLYPPLHSEKHQDLPAFFLKFFLQSVTGASPSLAALSVCLMENIWWTATKPLFTCECSNQSYQDCLFSKTENEFTYLIQTKFISISSTRFKAEIPSCSLMGNKMKELKMQCFGQNTCICSRKKVITRRYARLMMNESLFVPNVSKKLFKSS